MFFFHEIASNLPFSETMSWLVKKYQDIVNLEVEILDSKNDCRKLIITYKDGSTSKMVYLGPIPDGPVTTFVC